MLIFKQGLDEVVTIYSINQLFNQVEGDPVATPYPTDQALPDFNNNPGKFYYPQDNWPIGDGESLQIGASKTYAKTQQTFSVGAVTDFGMCCLPTPPVRNSDTVIYYQPIGTGLKVMVTSKTWEQGTGQYNFIHDTNTLSLVIYNGTNKGVYGPVKVTGRTEITGYDVQPLDYDSMVDEQTIVSTLSEELFNKAWVENYINKRLEVVIPEAVNESVKQSEIVISQRYVSR